jgi:hypothetical protein
MIENYAHAELDILFSFLKEVISWRFENPKGDFQKEAPVLPIEKLNGIYCTRFINKYHFSQEEIVVFLLALTPNIIPDLIVNCVAEIFPSGTDLPLFGGVKGKQHRGILPTGETVQFILAGSDVQRRIDCFSLFTEIAKLELSKTVYLENPPIGEPLMSGKILIYPETIHLVTTGIVPPPKMSASFPAERLETKLEWKDLILSAKTREEIKELEIWLDHNLTFLNDWGMKNRVKAVIRVLFHGPPGTGKTLTAALLGKYTNHPVYRIDLSTVVSKYIGETEKNLSNLFDKAAHKDWILFFDEADAIFGKRTNVRDAHDKYANQEVSYLLQRVESHPGLVILATNFKENIDDAFMRRFQSVCEFQMPSSAERLQLWESNLPNKLLLSPDIDLIDVSEKYELNGSNIVNIIQYCSLKVLSQNGTTLTRLFLIEGIKKEFTKEDRLF